MNSCTLLIENSIWKFVSIFSVFSIRLCVRFVRCLVSDVEAITFHGVGRSCSFMARSIAYDPRTSVAEVFFLGPVLAPRGRAWSPFSLYFIPSQSRTGKKAGKTQKTGKKPGKPEKIGKTGKTGKTRKNRKTGRNRKNREKTGKNRKRREKGSQNIKACRIENTLKLVTSP